MIGYYLEAIAAELKRSLSLPKESIDLVTAEFQAYATSPPVFYGLYADSSQYVGADENSIRIEFSIGLTVSSRVDAPFSGAGEIHYGLKYPFDFYQQIPSLAVVFRSAFIKCAQQMHDEAVSKRMPPWQFEEFPELASIGIPPSPKSISWWNQEGNHIAGFASTIHARGARVVISNPSRFDSGVL